MFYQVLVKDIFIKNCFASRYFGTVYYKVEQNKNILLRIYCAIYSSYTAITFFITSGPGAPRVSRFSTHVLRLMAS